jgi:hypothetical protein
MAFLVAAVFLLRSLSFFCLRAAAAALALARIILILAALALLSLRAASFAFLILRALASAASFLARALASRIFLNFSAWATRTPVGMSWNSLLGVSKMPFF